MVTGRVYMNFFKLRRRKYVWYILVTINDVDSYTLAGVSKHPPTEQELIDQLCEREKIGPFTRI